MTDAATTTEDLQREIDTALQLADATPINMAYLALGIIQKGDDPIIPTLLRHLAFEWGEKESTNEVAVDAIITEEQLKRLQESYGGLVDQLLQLLVRSRPTEEDFYSGIWKIITNPALEGDQARAFALYWVLIDKRIPYFQIDEGLRMSGDDWRSLLAKTRLEQKRMRFILYSQFDQANQRADLLLRELDSKMDQPAERIILMASILWALEDDRQRAAGMAS